MSGKGKLGRVIVGREEMKMSGITFTGPEIDDEELLSSLPPDLQQVLTDGNGFILLHGALHVRGVCSEPQWHSLLSAWHGDAAFHKLYDAVTPEDIPFAQDCVGDQFLLRDGHVVRLLAETGEAEGVALDMQEFLAKVEEDPGEFLGSAPDHPLKPGQLLHAYPPFCTKESAVDCSLKPCPTQEVVLFHADLAKQIGKIPDGGQFDVVVTS